MKFLPQAVSTCLLLALFSGPVFSQTQRDRIEIESSEFSSGEGIVPIGKDGVIVFYKTSKSLPGGGQNWVFTRYTTEFEKDWESKFPVRRGLEFINYDEDEDNVYLYVGNDGLWSSSSGINENTGRTVVITVNKRQGEIRSTPMEVERGSISGFKVIDGQAYFSGFTLPDKFMTCVACYGGFCFPPLFLVTIPMMPKIFKTNPLVQRLNLRTGGNQNYEQKLKGVSFVVSTTSNPYTGELDVIVRNEPTPKESQLLLQSFDKNELVESVALEADVDKYLVSADLSYLSERRSLIIGTYSNTARSGFGFGPALITTRYNTTSNGLFIAQLRDREMKRTKYYDFTEFKSLEATLSNRQRNKKNRNELTEINYRLLTHDIIPTKAGFIMIAEAYYPTYRTEYTDVYNSATGTWTTQTRRVFDGFVTSDAIVAGFSDEGDLLWENSFEMGDVKSYRLKEQVIMLPSEEGMVLTYTNGYSIFTKVMDESTVVSEKEREAIVTDETEEERIKYSNADVAYWYDNYFLSYGVQRIKNKEKGSNKKRKRTVFFFSKIES